jgi:hypothetical protein
MLSQPFIAPGSTGLDAGTDLSGLVAIRCSLGCWGGSCGLSPQPVPVPGLTLLPAPPSSYSMRTHSSALLEAVCSPSWLAICCEGPLGTGHHVSRAHASGYPVGVRGSRLAFAVYTTAMCRVLYRSSACLYATLLADRRETRGS